MDFCKYKNILGEPGKGIHAYRIFNISIVDVILTLIGSYILSHLFKISYLYMTISLFILGVFIHRLFCVKTPITKLLFK